MADEVTRFGVLNNALKQEAVKKRSLQDHKNEAEKELRRAVE